MELREDTMTSTATVTTTAARQPRRKAGGGKRIRDRQRAAHLFTGALLVLYVYLPALPASPAGWAIRWVALPLLVIDGILMWQWPRVRRLARLVGGQARRLGGWR
jgi:hypothetical protein